MCIRDRIGSATVQSVYVDGDLDGWTPAGGDCDDGDAAVHPGAPDPVGDGVDQNCDGPDGVDADGDGSLAPSSGGDDCRDDDPSIRPGAVEVCDGIDQDCDGVIDEEAVDAALFFPDRDGDGFGDPLEPVAGCTVPSGGVGNDLDCDDGEAAVFPLSLIHI